MWLVQSRHQHWAKIGQDRKFTSQEHYRSIFLMNIEIALKKLVNCTQQDI